MGQVGDLQQRPPRPGHNLAVTVVRALLTGDEGGLCQAVECALLTPGTGLVTYTTEIKVQPWGSWAYLSSVDAGVISSLRSIVWSGRFAGWGA